MFERTPLSPTLFSKLTLSSTFYSSKNRLGLKFGKFLAPLTVKVNLSLVLATIPIGLRLQEIHMTKTMSQESFHMLIFILALFDSFFARTFLIIETFVSFLSLTMVFVITF